MIGHLQVRAAPAARVPHGKYLNVTAVHAVVEEVVYPSQMQTPHPLSANIPHRCANPRLNAQEGKSLREFLVKGFRRKRTILIPPEGGPVNLRLPSLRDANFHGSLSHDDARASRALPPLKPFRRGQPRRSREEARLPPQV